MSDVTLVTCTADRPAGFFLAEQYMLRQTVWSDRIEWIVVDNGVERAEPTLGQVHLWQDSSGYTPAQRFCLNMLVGIEAAGGDTVCFIEDDDWYGATHVERQLERLNGRQIAGDCRQRYYNVRQRCWKQQGNIGATMAQTAIRRELLPALRRTVEACFSADSYGVDTRFWSECIGDPEVRCAQFLGGEVLGVKGLPGRPGLGWGHRPDRSWTADPHWLKLREWIGEIDAGIYRLLMEQDDE